MYSATCEAYLESLAEDREGVLDAEGELRHGDDPGLNTTQTLFRKESLRDVLSTRLGTRHTSVKMPHQMGLAGGNDAPRTEMGGIRKRRDDQLFGNDDTRLGSSSVRFCSCRTSAFCIPRTSRRYSTGKRSKYLRARSSWTVRSVRLPPAVFRDDQDHSRLHRSPVLRGAYISLKMRRPNTDLLVAITAVSAYAYSTAAVVLGQNDIFTIRNRRHGRGHRDGVLRVVDQTARALNRLTELNDITG